MGSKRIVDMKVIDTYFYDLENILKEEIYSDKTKINIKIESINSVPRLVKKHVDPAFPNTTEERIEKSTLIIEYSYENKN